MKRVPYFSHDADSRRDPKMTALISRYGMGGYGSFWVIIEMFREQDEFKLPCKPYTYEAIAKETGMVIEDVEKLIKALIYYRNCSVYICCILKIDPLWKRQT